MPLKGLRKIFNRNRKIKKYKLQRYDTKDETRLNKVKKFFSRKLHLRRENSAKVGLHSYNIDTKLFLADDNPDAIFNHSWINNSQKADDTELTGLRMVVASLENQLHAKDSENARLRMQLDLTEGESNQQKETLAAQTQMMQEMRFSLLNLQQAELQTSNISDVSAEDISSMQATILQYEVNTTALQNRVAELTEQNTALQNEMANLQEVSRNILNTHVSNSSGIIFGDNNYLDMNAANNETYLRVSGEVRDNLGCISSRMTDLLNTCDQMNRHLSQQTDLVKKIDESVTTLSENPIARDTAVASELQNMKHLIQQIHGAQDSASDGSRTSCASLPLEFNASAPFAMWTLQDDQNKVLKKLELLPKMSSMVEKIHDWVRLQPGSTEYICLKQGKLF